MRPAIAAVSDLSVQLIHDGLLLPNDGCIARMCVELEASGIPHATLTSREMAHAIRILRGVPDSGAC